MYDIGQIEPNIQVLRADLKGDRKLTLQHIRHNGVPLDPRRKSRHSLMCAGFGAMTCLLRASSASRRSSRPTAHPSCRRLDMLGGY